MAMAGPYFFYSITSRWNIGSKLLTDISSNQSFLSQETMSFPRIVASVSEVEYLSPTKLRKTIASVSSLITISSLLTAKNGEWMNTLAVGTTFGVNL